jgi:hypothetical protein
MSNNRSTLNKPDAEFLAQVNAIKEQCTENAMAWDIDQTRLMTLTHLTDSANTDYENNSNPITRNQVTSAKKKASFGELKHFLGPFIDYLEGNLNVPESALAFMGLRPRTHHAHAPLPVPPVAPVATLVRQHDEITVYVAQPEHSQPTQSVNPKRYHGFKLRWRFAGETEDRFEITTRLHFTLHFDRADEGKTVILAAAWVNPRLEAGPWSPDVTEVLG